MTTTALKKPFDVSFEVEAAFGTDPAGTKVSFKNTMTEPPDISNFDIGNFGEGVNDYDDTQFMPEKAGYNGSFTLKFPLFMSGKANNMTGEAEPAWAAFFDGIAKAITDNVNDAVGAGTDTDTVAVTTGTNFAAGKAIVVAGAPEISCVADPDTEFFTDNDHGLENGDQILFDGTTAPTGITFGLYYYVVNKTTHTWQVALTYGGAVVTYTTAGTAVTYRKRNTADELNFIESIATNDLEMARAFSAIPTTGNTVYNTHGRGLVKAAADMAATLPSYTFYFYFHSHKVKAMGCSVNGSPKISGTAKGGVFVEIPFGVDNWSIVAAATPSETAITRGSFTKALSAGFYYDGTAKTWDMFEFDFGLKIDELPDVTGANGRAGWVLTGKTPTLKIGTLFSVDYYTHKIGTVPKAVVIDCLGDSVGNLFGLYIPTAKVDVKPKDYAGVSGAELTFTPLDSAVGSYDVYLAMG